MFQAMVSDPKDLVREMFKAQRAEHLKTKKWFALQTLAETAAEPLRLKAGKSTKKHEPLKERQDIMKGEPTRARMIIRINNNRNSTFL